MPSCFRRLLVLAGLLLAALSPVQAVIVTITSFGAGSWNAPDATLGVTGYVFEDFEDTTLVSGLLVGWNTAAGNVTPAATLPFTFAPVTQDPNGDAFDLGLWDGTRALVNTRTNQSYAYSAVANWGDIILSFTTPVTSVGFSLQQNEYDVGLIINSVNIGSLQSLTGLVPTGGRYGYIRIDAAPGTTISTLQLSNGRFSFNDGFVIDHVAFTTVPEPSTILLLLVGTFVLAGCRRRR